jgi:hypothetical protein
MAGPPAAPDQEFDVLLQAQGLVVPAHLSAGMAREYLLIRQMVLLLRGHRASPDLT